MIILTLRCYRCDKWSDYVIQPTDGQISVAVQCIACGDFFTAPLVEDDPEFEPIQRIPRKVNNESTDETPTKKKEKYGRTSRSRNL